jgi:lipopolysaccharide export system ATP-binding protein
VTPSTPPGEPDSPLNALILRVTAGDRSAVLCLLAIVQKANDAGHATFGDVVAAYREDYLAALAAEGRDVQTEAGRLSVDEVMGHLGNAVVPRLAAIGAVEAVPASLASTEILRLSGETLAAFTADRDALRSALRLTGEHPVSRRMRTPAIGVRVQGNSVLAASGLVKTYKKRHVVNQVALELHQGEIVGLLGPNGAGKTTTFYMIAGLIPPDAGTITLDRQDITRMPMFKRARQGIGYLSQEPSIFRKLSVEENILAILETLPISKAERLARLEQLLDELSIKHLRASKAYALSGGERRRLEITRALVTQPKFIMLDEPFAGVDPIAVNDIQGIVASLKDRGIGVLISDHNVEQTLDIVDRAYIMFEGTVKVSGPVRDLIFDDTVSTHYFGPTLTARLRARYAAGL